MKIGRKLNKLNSKQVFAAFVVFIFIAPVIALFFQPSSLPTGAYNYVNAVGGFKETGNSPVLENNSVVVLFYSIAGVTQTCADCQWEKPVLEQVNQSFDGKVILKEFNLDLSNVNMTTSEQNLFTTYSPQNQVPLIVIGNEYFRIGSGNSHGYSKQQEAQYLTQLIDQALNITA